MNFRAWDCDTCQADMQSVVDYMSSPEEAQTVIDALERKYLYKKKFLTSERRSRSENGSYMGVIMSEVLY